MTSATNIPVHVKKNRTAGDWAILILLIVGGLVMLFPFIVLLLNAFKTTADYNSSGPLSWPKEFSTVGLMKFWNRVNYPEKLWNSIWTSGLVAILAVVLSMFNAFALGIGRVKGRRWIVLLIMLANMLPQEAMLYPLYIMFKKIGLYIAMGNRHHLHRHPECFRYLSLVIGIRHIPEIHTGSGDYRRRKSLDHLP